MPSIVPLLPSTHTVTLASFSSHPPCFLQLTNGKPDPALLPLPLPPVFVQVMKPMEEMPFLTLESTFGDAEEVVARAVDPLVPVVDSDKHMALQVGE